jgi:hypothetical protein
MIGADIVPMVTFRLPAGSGASKDSGLTTREVEAKKKMTVKTANRLIMLDQSNS